MFLPNNMEKDFTHSLNILENLRKANLSPSSIEIVISSLQVREENSISILNKGQAEKHVRSEFENFVRYTVSEMPKSDYYQELYPRLLIPYKNGKIIYSN